MISIRTTTAAALLALGCAAAWPLAAAAAPAAPDAPPPPHAGMRHHGPEMLFEKLGLSADQKSRVQAIMQAKGPQMQKLHEQMRVNMQKLHELKPDDPKYSEVVSQVAQDNGALMTQSISAQGDMRAQMYAMLTPAQKKQLDELEAKMRERMQEAGKHWRHHGGMMEPMGPMGPMGPEGPEAPEAPPPPDAPPPPK
jgi:protein CpxP